MSVGGLGERSVARLVAQLESRSRQDHTYIHGSGDNCQRKILPELSTDDSTRMSRNRRVPWVIERKPQPSQHSSQTSPGRTGVALPFMGAVLVAPSPMQRYTWPSLDTLNAQ